MGSGIHSEDTYKKLYNQMGKNVISEWHTGVAYKGTVYKGTVCARKVISDYLYKLRSRCGHTISINEGMLLFIK